MDGHQVLTLGQHVTATPVFQAAAREILAKRGAGGPVVSQFNGLGQNGLGQRHPELFGASATLLVGAGIMTLTSIYIFRHVGDEKNGFWKTMGYIGGIAGFAGSLVLFLSSIGVTAAAFPFLAPQPK